MKHWRELTINLIFSHTCMKLCALGLDVHARTVNYQIREVKGIYRERVKGRGIEREVKGRR